MKKFMLFSALAAMSLFASELKITDIYAKATPPHAQTSAVFMKIQNNTDNNIYLLGGSSNASKFVEVHKHIKVNGMMKMIKLDNVMIPAHGTTLLQPGGYHMMLIDLKQGLTPNKKIDLKLDISTNPDSKNPQVIDIKNVVVKRFNMDMEHMHSHKHMHKHAHKHGMEAMHDDHDDDGCGCGMHEHANHHDHADMKMDKMAHKHMDMKMKDSAHEGCEKPQNGALMGTCSSK